MRKVKYLLIEKSKRVSVKPYQRKGKFVIEGKDLFWDKKSAKN
jgi:hypothetical protein